VDHVIGNYTEPDFAICSWRVNDAKSDLTPDEFLELCQTVVDFANQPRRRTKFTPK
jgi:hypothetical protein